MIDATVAPKVGFISPFGTTVCNVNHINARPEPLPAAGAPQTLEAVGSMALLGPALGPLSVLARCVPTNAPLAQRFSIPVLVRSLTGDHRALTPFATRGREKKCRLLVAPLQPSRSLKGRMGIGIKPLACF